MSKHITMKMWEDAGCFDAVAEAGDTVDEEIAMQFLNCVPPLIQRRDYFQSSEPFSNEFDEEKRFLCPTYSTFGKSKDGVWTFLGNCFRGDVTDRTFPKC